MTAAGGIVHEEKHGPEFTRTGGTMEMVQLWVNLPARDKRKPPGYQDLLARDIPTVALPGGAGEARVIAGSCEGTRGPARTFTPIDLWDVSLRADRTAKLTLPAGHTALLLVQRGTVRVAGSDAVATGELAILDREPGALELRAEGGDARVLVLSGAPIAESVVGMGPFVMNTRAEIVQAMRDYEAGRMGVLEES
jgi:redox-sensitive bicupin YhaK (pirin superfamily)